MRKYIGTIIDKSYLELRGFPKEILPKCIFIPTKKENIFDNIENEWIFIN
jgi:hypothetical protein